MNFGKRLNRTHVAGAVGMLLAVGCGLLLHEFRFGSGLVRASYDLLHTRRGEVRADEAVIVYLDDRSYEELKQPRNASWDRSLHARLVDRLSAAEARAVIFDITFTDPDRERPAVDEKLAAAMKRNGRVLLAADYLLTGPGMKQVRPPTDLLRDSAAEMGSDEVEPDPDLVVRHHTPKLDNPLSALAWMAARFLKTKATQNENQEDITRWVNYYGPPNFIPWKSYSDALEPSQVPDDFFRNKVVFIGGRLQTKFAAERKDEYVNPFGRFMPEEVKKEQGALFMAGVEIQATMFLNLLRGDWLRRFSWRTERLIIIAVGFLFGYGLIRVHPMVATALAMAGLALIVALFYFSFSRRLTWFPFLILVVQISIALFWSILFNSIQLYVQKRLYEQTLRVYLPPALVKKFSKSRDLLKPGAQKQTLTLFFSDIANFTSISEGMDSDELAGMMNQYFERAVSKCIHRSEGTVAKYLGDSIFAFWNAPDVQLEHPLRACEAALLFREQAAHPINGRTLRTRIGLHTGMANVGNFGSEERVDYTALGENVNLASRLEGLNKHLGTDILMSGETKAGIGEQLLTRPLGKFQLKGFEGLVDVQELIGRPDQAEPTREWREAFAEALNNYEQRNLEFAEIGFRRVLELRPNDGPSLFYIERIAELAAQTLPENWATHTVLKEK